MERVMRMTVRMALAGALAAGVAVAAQAGDVEPLKPGAAAPDFTLTDHQGQSHTLSQYRGQPVLLDFWSAKCPVSERYEERLKDLAATFGARGVVTLGIDANKTEDLELIQRVAQERQVPFPVLLDPGNQVADLYGGQTTPHIFIVDAAGAIAYQGAIDDEGMMGNKQVTRRHAAEALEALLTGQPVPSPETEAFGCSIKRVSP